MSGKRRRFSGERLFGFSENSGRGATLTRGLRDQRWIGPPPASTAVRITTTAIRQDTRWARVRLSSATTFARTAGQRRRPVSRTMQPASLRAALHAGRHDAGRVVLLDNHRALPRLCKVGAADHVGLAPAVVRAEIGAPGRGPRTLARRRGRCGAAARLGRRPRPSTRSVTSSTGSSGPARWP